jgi:hypothetical protein
VILLEATEGVIKMKLAIIGSLVAGLVFSPLTNAQARPPVEKISANRAQGLEGELPTITVWAGAGANLNLIPTGEIIKKAWLDDPSRIGLDSDEPLCVLSAGSDDDSCANSTATVIHLKRIHQIKFPSLPSTANTLLSVVTENKNGDRALYQFRIAYGKGNPEYHTVTIYPDIAPSSSASSAKQNNLEQLQNIEQGLKVAKSKRLLGKSQGNQNLELRVRRFLFLVRGGTKVSLAMKKAGVSPQLVSKLEELGSTYYTQFSRKAPTNLSPQFNLSR